MFLPASAAKIIFKYLRESVTRNQIKKTNDFLIIVKLRAKREM